MPYYAESDDEGICGAIILIPFVRQGITLAHHAHICSKYHNKKLILFIRRWMAWAIENQGLGLICVETKGKPEFEIGARLAKFVGFIPVRIGDMTYDDYHFNSKEIQSHG